MHSRSSGRFSCGSRAGKTTCSRSRCRTNARLEVDGEGRGEGFVVVARLEPVERELGPFIGETEHRAELYFAVLVAESGALRGESAVDPVRRRHGQFRPTVEVVVVGSIQVEHELAFGV